MLLDTDFSRLTRDFVGPRNKRRGPALRGAEAVAPIPHPRTARRYFETAPTDSPSVRASARTLKLLACSPISCFSFDMEILSFGMTSLPRTKSPKATRSANRSISSRPPPRHDREHFSTIVNTAPRMAPKCSRSRGTLFTLPWNPCSPSRGNPVHDRVEYAVFARSVRRGCINQIVFNLVSERRRAFQSVP